MGSGGVAANGGTGDTGQGGTNSVGGDAGAPAAGEGGAIEETGGMSSGGKAGSGGTAGKAGSSGGGGKGGAGGSAGKAGGGGTAGASGTAGSSACTPITISDPIAQFDGTFRTVIAADVSPTLGDPALPDLFHLEFYPDLGGDETGTITLGTGEEADYETCGQCVIIAQDIEDQTPQTYYFATAGTLTLTSGAQQLNGYPQGTLRNVTLREVTVDAATYHSTIVPGGACLTLANGDAAVNIDPPVPGWLDCGADWYGDGDCDCGCGAVDIDCSGAAASACDYCWCDSDPHADPLDGSCDGSNGVNTTNNGVCQ
jgi:hypothetical protein